MTTVSWLIFIRDANLESFKTKPKDLTLTTNFRLLCKCFEGLSCDSGHQFAMDWIPDGGRSHSTVGVSSSYPKQTSNKHLLGDISPYRHLESLSLQMTEQAIN